MTVIRDGRVRAEGFRDGDAIVYDWGFTWEGTGREQRSYILLATGFQINQPVIFPEQQRGWWYYGGRMAVARFASIVFDCSDPEELARFWAAMVGGEVAAAGDEFVAVRTAYGWFAAMRVADHRPPTWADPAVPKQVHVDLSVDDLDTAAEAAVRLGATLLPGQPAPDRYRVLLDPAGHPFCLSVQIPR
ncbi:VOC family protein [Dactylosporangium matsuzakiense]|uniref:VOC family protein n=1 Tax=Dactylosporangium matsuzakiense TaxID=53360 RepID=UPI0031EDCA4B